MTVVPCDARPVSGRLRSLSVTAAGGFPCESTRDGFSPPRRVAPGAGTTYVDQNAIGRPGLIVADARKRRFSARKHESQTGFAS